jgi:hypothetical protein
LKICSMEKINRRFWWVRVVLQSRYALECKKDCRRMIGVVDFYFSFRTREYLVMMGAELSKTPDSLVLKLK